MQLNNTKNKSQLFIQNQNVYLSRNLNSNVNSLPLLRAALEKRIKSTLNGIRALKLSEYVVSLYLLWLKSKSCIDPAASISLIDFTMESTTTKTAV